MKNWLVKVEWLVGGISVVLGALLQFLLLRQGVLVPGALMLVATGGLLCAIAWKDQMGLFYRAFGENVLAVLRRTLLFLNIMLAVLVVVTLLGGLA